MTSPLSPHPLDLKWRQYATHIELYKFYLDLSFKAFGFYYAVTGAILSFYFAHEADSRIKLALLLPIAMSVSLGGLFIYGGRILGKVRDEVFAIASKLQLETGPDLRVLSVTLYVFATVIGATAVALGLLFWAQL
jgi:hypothetical protein